MSTPIQSAISAGATMQLLPAEPVIALLQDLSRRLDKALQQPRADDPAYLPLRKLGERYGMSPSCVRRYADSAIADGAITVIRPRDHAGTIGDRLYNVADFEAYISRANSPDTK